FLPAFEDSDVAWRVGMRRLRALTAEDPEQQRSLAELEAMMSARFDELRETTRLRNTEGMAAAVEAIQKDVLQTPTRKIRALIASIDARERRLMEQRRHRAELFNVAVLVALFAAASTAVTAVIVSQRRRAEAERLARLGESFVAVLGHDL